MYEKKQLCLYSKIPVTSQYFRRSGLLGHFFVKIVFQGRQKWKLTTFKIHHFSGNKKYGFNVFKSNLPYLSCYCPNTGKNGKIFDSSGFIIDTSIPLDRQRSPYNYDKKFFLQIFNQ